MTKLHFWEHCLDFSVAFTVFVVTFSMASFFAKKGGHGPEQAGAPGAPKKSSQLLEFALKAKRARERER